MRTNHVFQLRSIQLYYTILFLVGVIASIVCNYLSPNFVTKLYTCNEHRVYNLFPFCLLCILQCLLLIPKKVGFGLLDSSRDGFNTQNSILSFNNIESNLTTSQSSIITPITTFTFPSKSEGDSYTTDTKFNDNDIIVEENVDDYQRFFCYEICWDSVWTIFFQAMFFLSYHATLLGSRIFGVIHTNQTAINTCPHLKTFSLSLGSPALTTPILSEEVFILIYLSITTYTLCIRRTGDPYSFRHFISFKFFTESKFFGIARLLIQIVIFVYSAALIMAIAYYRSSPIIHIMLGFTTAFASLWTVSVLSHLSGVDQPKYNFIPELKFTWLWAIVSIVSVWFCSFLFHTSVYGFLVNSPYHYIHFVTFAIFLIIIPLKGSKIFEWTHSIKEMINMN